MEWGIVGIVIYMLVCLLISSRAKIDALREENKALKKELSALDCNFDSAKGMMESYSGMINELIDANESLQKELEELKNSSEE